jgi:hypothetical protein
MSDNELMNIILQRLNRQDHSLDEIKANQSEMKSKLDTHMMMEAEVKPSIDELIAVLNGSKLIGRLVIWACSLIGMIWAALAWARDHVKL